MRRGFFKKGEGPGTGAPLILLIILVLVLYIILLPPEQREELLSSGTVTIPNTQSPGTGTTPNGITADDEFIFEGPGSVEYVSRQNYEHTIPAQTIYTRTDAQVILQENAFTIEKGWFKNTSHTITLPINNPNNINNIALTFTAPVNQGILYIYLNGQVVYSNDIEGAHPILVKLNAKDILPVNTITFEVSGVGAAFWRTNRYSIAEISIQGDVTDVSRSAGDATFSLRSTEAINLERASLRFIPECSTANVGTLSGYINGQRIFSRIPDCGIPNVYSIDKSILREGTNTMQFVTTQGNYIIDDISIQTFLDDDRDYVYYFTLDENLFFFDLDEQPVCGQIDGVCPDSCDEDVDIDCCYDEYDTAYWCDAPTTLQDDRCVGTVTQANIFRCPSGYEDDRGRVPDDFEGICGDDDDGKCPVGCSMFYDSDCCLDQPDQRYFCHDLPITGIQDVCVQEVSQDMCSLCPFGYEGNEGDPDTCYQNANPVFEDVMLKDQYIATAKLYFIDDRDSKVATIRINGFATRIDTRDDFVQVDISEYVRDNSNYIQIIPESKFDLVEVRVDIDVDTGKTPQRRNPDTGSR